MNKLEVMTKIRNDVVLSQIACIEPVTLDSIIDQALAHPQGVVRWNAYERLKRQASEIVGWYATCPELGTSKHYDAMINLIDELLPVPSENDAPDYDDLARKRREDRGPVHISVLVDEFLEDLARRTLPPDGQVM